MDDKAYANSVTGYGISSGLNDAGFQFYEDNVSGRISDERFALMSKTYEDEQVELKEQIQILRGEID